MQRWNNTSSYSFHRILTQLDLHSTNSSRHDCWVGCPASPASSDRTDTSRISPSQVGFCLAFLATPGVSADLWNACRLTCPALSAARSDWLPQWHDMENTSKTSPEAAPSQEGLLDGGCLCVPAAAKCAGQADRFSTSRVPLRCAGIPDFSLFSFNLSSRCPIVFELSFPRSYVTP